jgi:hypothetical protein
MDRCFLHRTLRESALSLLLCGLVFAPWAYGCTTPWAIGILEALLGTVFVLWLASCAVEKKRPAVALLPLLCAAWLVGQGSFMAWNAHFRHDAALHAFEPVAQAAWGLPGAIDGPWAWSATLRAAVMLFVLILVADLARDKTARRRLLLAMALSGASVMLLGLLQKASGAAMIFWQPGPARSPFFGAYYYHGNAGSFINLTLPLIAAFALRSAERGRGRTFWIPALLIAFASAVVNLSRAASFLSAGIALVLAVHEMRNLLRHRAWIIPRGSITAAVVIGAIALAAVAEVSGSSQAVEKWTWLNGQLNTANPRYIVAQVCCDMARDSGLCGFGPGTFALAFPHYTPPVGDAIRGVWRYAHQDYLQTFIEWGALGTLFWSILLFGAITRFFEGNLHPEPDPHLRLACALALIATALHALVDFPFQIASLQLYVAVLCGIGWACGSPISLPRAVSRCSLAARPLLFSSSFFGYRNARGEIVPTCPRGNRWRSRRRY